jgi:hypothetical protein
MKILWLLVINLGITSAGLRLNRVSSFPSGLGFCGIWLPLELWRGHAVLVAWSMVGNSGGVLVDEQAHG